MPRAKRNATGPLSDLRINYDAAYHKDCPHVLKFSGGRSSGAMLIGLLESGVLKRERGDVIVFNNTSAEHPDTYDFVRKCTRYAEKEHGIPFFWIEFATYEDAHNGEWKHHPTFRLVKPKPRKRGNDDGYHWRGEVFEELVSWQGFLPSRHTRTCTSYMKLRTTSAFLTEWLAAKSETKRRGHFYDESQITDEDLWRRHKNSRGKMSREEFLRKKAFLRTRPPIRPAQPFDAYSTIGAHHLLNSPLSGKSFDGLAPMTGESAAKYVSLIGLRADEPRRAVRIKERNEKDSEDGEYIHMPLVDSQVTKPDVLDFWSAWKWNLRIPDAENLSNCVYCFMKGGNALRRIAAKRAETGAPVPGTSRDARDTPAELDWWVGLEERYRRVPKRRKGSKAQDTVTIGFWGVDAKESYKRIRDSSGADAPQTGPDALPCDCTD